MPLTGPAPSAMSRTTQSKPQAFKHARRVAWRKVADEAVILDVETATYYSLNGAGLKIWELLGAGRSAAEISRDLAREYDAPEETIRRDVEELTRRMRQEKILEPA